MDVMSKGRISYCIFVCVFSLSFNGIFFSREVLLAENAQEPAPSKTSYTYVGNRECRICHPQNFQMWHVEEHARAFEKLKKMEDNPYCLKCHTTGFGEEGGYANQLKTPYLKGVQCEACHGPGSGHVKAQGDKKNVIIKTQLEYENTCRKCHDKDWDPEFDYQVFKEKIHHWIKEVKPDFKLKPR